MGIVQVGLILGGNFLWCKFSGWELSGGNHPGGNFPGGSFHVTENCNFNFSLKYVFYWEDTHEIFLSEYFMKYSFKGTS